MEVNLAGEISCPTPIRIPNNPIDMQYTADHICVLLLWAKEACILLNQFT